MVITKLKLHNFKRFSTLVIPFDERINILVGDNESGKSTLLQAIDIVMRGSRHLVEEEGLEKLFNYAAVATFMDRDVKSIADLPEMYIELYLNDTGNPFLNGMNNSDGFGCDGLKLVCKPSFEYSETIANILSSGDPAFPFEYYDISFSTFRGDGYTGHNRPMRGVSIDNSTIGSEFAMFQYVQDIFKAKLTDEERTLARHQYHTAKCNFKKTALSRYDAKLSGYSFSVKESSKDNLDTDLTIIEGGIDISNKGTGKQCFIKTELALKQADDRTNVVLLEEPENHLSHLNMLRMVQTISESENKQIFIATHSNLISTRLNIQKCSIFNSNSTAFVQLKNISQDTASFFIKAPDNNLLQFILSNKAILVEGDAEFMLMDFFCMKTLGKTLNQIKVDVIAVDGKCFKRYIEVAKAIGIKTAVITDNDGSYEKNIEEAYDGLIGESIQVFSDHNNERYTFEVCLYGNNEEICNNLFGEKLRTRSVEQFMLANKAECAYQIALAEPNDFVVPDYINDALQWIKD